MIRQQHTRRRILAFAAPVLSIVSSLGISLKENLFKSRSEKPGRLPSLLEFQQSIASEFTVAHPEGSIELRLKAVDSRKDHPQLEQFSLVFETLSNRNLESTLAVSHAKLGRFEMYIQSIGSTLQAPYICEAIVSRVKGTHLV